jgi:hypothetical protein
MGEGPQCEPMIANRTRESRPSGMTWGAYGNVDILRLQGIARAVFLSRPCVSLSEVPEEQGYRLIKSPGAGRQLPAAREPATGHKGRERTRDRAASLAGVATRDGQGAVLAEHSTAGEGEASIREGGEPRPKGPTGGKATPGIPLDWEDRGERLRAHQPSQRNASGLRSRLKGIQRWSSLRWPT